MPSALFYSKVIQKIGRARNYHSNSWPRISGDAFADFADYHYRPPRFRRFLQKTEIRDAKTIFCQSHDIEDLLQSHGDQISAGVILLGNSDRNFHEFDFNLPVSVKRVYVQNLNFKDPKFRVLPIGIENLRLNFNGVEVNFSEEFISENKLNQVLVGPFGNSNKDRSFAATMEKSNNCFTKVLDKRISPLDYARISSKFKFIACPVGNGIDTHRFWETLYRGGIPIIKKSEWSENLKVLNIPFAEIEDWNQDALISIVESSKLEQLSPHNYESLWMPYWVDEINQIISI